MLSLKHAQFTVTPKFIIEILCRDGVVTWLVNLLFAIISVLTVFAWVGISGLDSTNVVKTNAFIYFVYYHISDSLWAGLVFALIFLAGLNSMVMKTHKLP